MFLFLKATPTGQESYSFARLALVYLPLASKVGLRALILDTSQKLSVPKMIVLAAFTAVDVVVVSEGVANRFELDRDFAGERGLTLRSLEANLCDAYLAEVCVASLRNLSVVVVVLELQSNFSGWDPSDSPETH